MDGETIGRCGKCGWASDNANVAGTVLCHNVVVQTQMVMTPQGPSMLNPYPWPVMNAADDFCPNHKEGEPVKPSKIIQAPKGFKGIPPGGMLKN